MKLIEKQEGSSLYFIDRKKIEETLVYMEDLLKVYGKNKGTQEKSIRSLANERIALVVIESILDVGNSMIDGFIMRDPGSYDDIIDIMEDEQVITSDMVEPLKKVIALRTMIVRQFINVDVEEIEMVLDETIEPLLLFPNKVRHYLENELGPVSAFIPLDK